MIIKKINAFTLSEMMIVLLVVSVVSAITLPSLTTRQTNDNATVVQSDNSWNRYEAESDGASGGYGIYNISYPNSAYKVIVGLDIDSFTDINTDVKYYPVSQYGRSALVFASNLGNMINLYQRGNSPNTNIFAGSLVLDMARNIGIGALDSDFSSSTGTISSMVGSNSSIHIGRFTETKEHSLSAISSDNYSIIAGYIPAYGASSIKNHNVVMGYYAMNGTGSSIYRSNIIGSYACANSNAGNDSVLIGNNVARNNSNISTSLNNSIAIGTNAASGKTAAGITAGISIGNYANAHGNGGFAGVAIGNYAAYGAVGYDGYTSIAIGPYAGHLSNMKYGSSYDNVLIGHYAGASSAADTKSNLGYNVIMGNYAGYTTSAHNLEKSVILGYNAGKNASALSSVFIGSGAGNGAGTITNGIFIGNNAGSSNSNSSDSIVIGNGGQAGTSGINIGSPGKVGDYSIAIGSGCSAELLNIVNSYNNKTCIIPGPIGKNVTSVMTSANPTTSVDQVDTYMNTIDPLDRDANITIKQKDFKMNTTYHQSSYATTIDLITIPSVRETTAANIWGANSRAQMVIAPASTSAQWGKDTDGYYMTSIALDGAVFGKNQMMTIYSDKRLKTNIKPTKYGLNEIRKINIYEFNMKKDKQTKRIGVIAQELKDIMPEAVTKEPLSGMYAVNGDWIINTSVQAIKEIDKIFSSISENLQEYIAFASKTDKYTDNLNHRLKNLSDSNKQLNSKLDKIESMRSRQ